MVGTGTEEKCVAGQRVRLVGRVSSQNHWTEQKKLRQKIIIKAGEFELLPKTDTQPDMNRVELSSQIYSNIEHTNACSAFTMTTQHTTK